MKTPLHAVEAVLRSGKVNYWTGRKGMEFEKKFARWQGSKYAISVATGTAALHVALSALGIGPGDEVIVPSYTFIATSFSVVQAGAIPRFADVNLEDHCISLASAEKLVTPRTKAIMPVHLYGNVADMDTIWAFAQKHNLYVIEDNAEAFGGEYKGRKTGTLGHIAGCSFCQNKTFTTGGEGGMVTTDDEDLAWKARSFRDHGYDVQARMSLLEMEQKLPYIHNRVGWNYRMTEMQSAIGIAELERIDTWNMPTRRRNAHILMDRLKTLPQVRFLPIDTPERRNGWYVLAFSLNIEDMTCDIAQFVKSLRRRRSPSLESLLASVPYRKSFPAPAELWEIRLSLHLTGIYGPSQRGLQPGRGSQRPLARGAHLHLFCLPYLQRGRHAPDRGCTRKGHPRLQKINGDYSAMAGSVPRQPEQKQKILKFRRTMNILAVGCHPDDLEIGCGGTLARYAQAGHRVTMCIVANGNMGHVVLQPAELRAIRAAEARRAGAILGAAEVVLLDVNDLEVDSNRTETVNKLVDLVRRVQPDVILTHPPEDYMKDHVEVSRLVFDASFSASVPHYLHLHPGVAKITPLYYMDTVAGINFIPSEYVDVSATLDVKLAGAQLP